MIIQHNIMAMNAYRNYKTNTSALSSNLEKLSSGYKINRAGDDAAGLAISEKMRAQITGLEAAQKNVKDGISLVKTAEGAMQEIQDMLNRMDYLATQSANGTYQDEVDRENLNKEMEALKTEINRIADSANFNGIKLLDGSLDETNTTGRTSETAAAQLSAMTIPAAGTGTPNADMDSDKTVLKKAGTEASQTKFNVDLRTLGANGADGDEMAISIGDATVTIKFSDTGADLDNATATVDTTDNKSADITLKSGSYSASDLATAISKAFGKDGVQIGGEEFTVGTDKGVLTFTESGTGSGVSGALAVKVEYTESGATVATPFAAASTSTVTGDLGDAVVAGTKTTLDATDFSGDDSVSISGTSATVDFSGLDAGAVVDAMMAAGEKGTASDTIDLVWDSTANGNSGNWTLQVNGTTIAEADLDNGSAVTLGGNGATTDISFGDIGTITVDETSGASNGTGDFTGGISTSVAVATPSADGALIDFSGLDKDELAQLAEDAGASDGDKITMSWNSDHFELKAGNTLIAQSTTSVSVDDNSITFYTDPTDNSTALTGTVAVSAVGTIANTTYANPVETGVSYSDGTANNPNPPADDTAVTGPKGQYESKTIVISSGEQEKEQQLASTVLTLSDSFIKDGGALKIGGTTITFKAGDATSVSADGSTVTFDQSLTGTALYDAVGEALSRITSVDGAFDLGYVKGSGKLGVFEQNGQSKYGVDVLGNQAEFAKLFSSGTAAVTETSEPGKALNLQIGDSSDSFNQMKIAVGDMHVDAMGTFDDDGNLTTSIDNIDILTSDNAQKAVDVIKNAINYVSSIRGDLGAYQNRLEHTANNLSVMAENITDAESTIRDTDVAEEMMSYVKNNILVQSAQAMLAQANQVPQGVLQLLG